MEEDQGAALPSGDPSSQERDQGSRVRGLPDVASGRAAVVHPTRFCPACGTTLVATAVVCPNCGSAVGSARTKSTAVLLAVFLAFWTWLYTYRADNWKFWIGLGLDVAGVVTTFFGIGWLVLIGVWIWAVADTASKSDVWYQTFAERR